MSVIAKMQLNGTLDFGSGSLSKLSCVCENDLMAAYAGSEEDRLFTKYSPWGEMKLGYGFKTERSGLPKFQPGHKFYVMAVRSASKPACPGAEHVHPCSVRVIHDYGSSKQVELAYDPRTVGAQPSYAMDEHPGEFHWRMTIDNPPAVAFFEPGKSGYWVAFYDAEKFDRDAAIADAHSVEVE